MILLAMNQITKKVKWNFKKLRIGDYKLRPVDISEFGFADDLTICAASERELQVNLTIWNMEWV